jgi:hypothetical protein
VATRKRAGGLGENNAFTTPSESSPIHPEEPIHPEAETPQLNEAAEAVVEERGPAAAEATEVVTEPAETKDVPPGHGLHLPNLKELKMPNLGEVKMPNLGEVKMPNLGEVKMPNLSEVKMPNLSEVKMPNLGEVKMPDLDAMRAQGEASVRHLVEAGTEKSSVAVRWGVTAGAALAGGVVGMVVAKGLTVGGISLLSPSILAVTGVIAGGALGWRRMRPGRTQSGEPARPAKAVAAENAETAVPEQIAA